MVVAGLSGTCAFAGDGGLSPAAAICRPYGIAVDPEGSIVFADSGNRRLRKIMVGTSMIITIAGGGTSTLNDVPATTASLAGLRDVAIDPTGTIYIVDSGAGLLRVISAATGLIRTLASGMQVGGMLAMTVNPLTGAVLVADDLMGIISSVHPVTGAATRLAGGGTVIPGSTAGVNALQADLRTPAGLAVDARGTVYMSSGDRNRVYAVSASDGTVSLVAGDGFVDPTDGITGRFTGDGGDPTLASLSQPLGLAVSASGAQVYVSDYRSQRIRLVVRQVQEPSDNQASPTATTAPSRSATKRAMALSSPSRSKSRTKKPKSKSKSKTRKRKMLRA